MFAAIGALASQIMPTRSRASALAATVFGVAFMLRALGDSATSARWLTDVSPLGWVEQLRPLAGPQPIWLVPIIVLTGSVLPGRCCWPAGTWAPPCSATPTPCGARTALLRSPEAFTFRLSWASITGWLAAMALAGLLYGSFARSAGSLFSSSSLVRKITGGLTDVAASQLRVQGARVYAGVVFLILMTLIMAYVATAMGRARDEEAQGFLDNLFVREVSRRRWLAGYAGLAGLVAIAAAVLGGASFWLGAATQHAGLSLHEMVLAGHQQRPASPRLAGPWDRGVRLRAEADLASLLGDRGLGFSDRDAWLGR